MPAACYLLPNDIFDFILTTQPKEWQRLCQHYGDQVKWQSTIALIVNPPIATLEISVLRVS